ncbi:hypothetical protein ASE70_16855 [Sphingomonas sp. Leaf22]|nr:hypothetical protein ASE70_16855 [Sphingomonas sp. Leaf22]
MRARSGDGRGGLFFRTHAPAAARAVGSIVAGRQRRRQAVGFDRRCRFLDGGRRSFGAGARRAATDRLRFGRFSSNRNGCRFGYRSHVDLLLGLLRADFALDTAPFARIGGRLLHPATVAAQTLARLAFFPRRAVFARLTLFAWLTVVTGGTVVASLTFFTRLAILTRSAVVAGLTLFALAAVFARLAIVPGVAIVALGAGLAVVTIATIFTRAIVALVATIVAGLVLVEIEILVIGTVEIVAGATLFLDTRATGFEHAEIMVGELEVIFGVHPIAGALGVGGEVLVLFQQLRRIATRAIVDAIAVVARIAAAGSRLTLSTATATAAGLTIVHQGLVVLSLPVRRSTDRGCEQIRKAMHGHRPPAMTTGRQWRT